MAEHRMSDEWTGMAACTSDWSCEEEFAEYPVEFFMPPPPIPSFLRDELGFEDLGNKDGVESGQHPLSTVVGEAPNDFCHLCKWADPSFDNWSLSGGSGIHEIRSRMPRYSSWEGEFCDGRKRKAGVSSLSEQALKQFQRWFAAYLYRILILRPGHGHCYHAHRHPVIRSSDIPSNAAIEILAAANGDNGAKTSGCMSYQFFFPKPRRVFEGSHNFRRSRFRFPRARLTLLMRIDFPLVSDV
ncbi:unnamed protein product [Notodromas monacha]|uniref:Uncharacterized protein n=1 Tax=Notodromas monacha TaxID=399045 RepID=A0A7R9G872_9CRUS|nr:unnamed protein product [Notodromas monacha]CAG0912833.1 unnamed protein product [Notodromas monacha]